MHYCNVINMSQILVFVMKTTASSVLLSLKQYVMFWEGTKFVWKVKLVFSLKIFIKAFNSQMHILFSLEDIYSL